MIIININTDKSALIDIGRQGEHGVRQVWFDLSYLIENFGDGTALLVNQRPMDSAPYMVTTEQNGNTLVWTIGETDTAYEGFGKLEIRWTVNNDLAKTVVYRTMTAKSLTGDSQVPDPYQSWYDELIDYIDEHSISPEELGQAIEDYIAEHPISAPVQSVNGKTGDVTLTASDVGAGTYSKPSGGIPKTDLTSGVQASLDKADSALQSFTETDPTVPSWAKAQNKPSYTAQEVGALPSDTTIPTKVSQLQNDSGFGTYSKPSGGIPKTDLAEAVQTSLGKADSALQTAPVTSVNTKTGAVTLAAGDIGYDGTETYTSGTVGKAISDLKGDLNGKLDEPSTAGTNGQVLTSDGQGGQSWQTPQSGGAVSSVNGQTGTVVLDADDVGAIASPSSPTSGQFLKWNGSAWVASDLPVYSGGVS